MLCCVCAARTRAPFQIHHTAPYPGANLSDSNCANFYHFNSYNSSSTKSGTLSYHWTANNVRYPQYDADILDAGRISRWSRTGRARAIRVIWSHRCRTSTTGSASSR